jgi:hypothetical protein
MLMKVESDASLVKPLDRVLIVANGDLFVDEVYERFFQPSTDEIQNLFEKYGVESWVMELDTKSLNPTKSVGQKVRELNARYVLYFTASQVSVLELRGSTVRPGTQVAGYTLNFLINDLALGKNVWRAELRSAQGKRAKKEETPEIRENLEEQLLLAGLLKAANKLSLSPDRR